MRGIRITSDGTTRNTKVYIIDDDGEIADDITDITKFVYWELDAAEPTANVIIGVLPGEADVVGKLKELTNASSD